MTTLYITVLLLVGIASYSTTRGIKAVRMERANRMWSETHQTWRCRYGIHPDIK